MYNNKGVNTVGTRKVSRVGRESAAATGTEMEKYECWATWKIAAMSAAT